MILFNCYYSLLFLVLGVEELVSAMSKSKLEYFEFYRTELDKNIEKRIQEQQKKKEIEMKKLKEDLEGVKVE